MPGKLAISRMHMSNSTMIRFIVAGITLLALFQFGAQNLPLAQAYSCSGRCYALYEWPTPNNGIVYGTSTHIKVVQLSCTPSSCVNGSTGEETGFVDDETWLTDVWHNGSLCRDYNGGCWVEGGYSTFSQLFSGFPSTTVQYFWADNRPTSDGWGSFNLHYVGTVPSGDYGTNLAVQLTKTSTAGQYQIYLSAFGGTYAYSNPVGSLYMFTDTIDIGQELKGTTGAHAPTADFTANYWFDSNLYAHNQTAYSSSNETHGNPPYGYWSIYPYSNSTGGDYYTYCC
jgi:hypothetical protein